MLRRSDSVDSDLYSEDEVTSIYAGDRIDRNGDD